jgi:hypothetical protein
LRRNVLVSTVLTEPTVFNEWDENLNTNLEMEEVKPTEPSEKPEEVETNADDVQIQV